MFLGQSVVVQCFIYSCLLSVLLFARIASTKFECDVARARRPISWCLHVFLFLNHIAERDRQGNGGREREACTGGQMPGS